MKNPIFILFIILVSCSSPKKFEISSYQRKNWKHWIDEDRDCQNTRAEILSQRSTAQVVFSKNGCTVKRGRWNDYYYPEVLSQAKLIDIDHLVPLKHAHYSGGADWSADKKKHFANDPDNLVITNRRFNRMKGAKGIDQWLPVKIDYACKYTKDWIKIKTKYGLQFSPEENKTIGDLKPKCHNLTF